VTRHATSRGKDRPEGNAVATLFVPMAEDIGAFAVAKMALAHAHAQCDDSLFMGLTGDVMLVEVASGGPVAGRDC
jgi:hypothetical protein